MEGEGESGREGGRSPAPSQCGRGCSTMPGAACPCPKQDWCRLGSPSPPWGSPPQNGFEVGGLVGFPISQGTGALRFCTLFWSCSPVSEPPRLRAGAEERFSSLRFPEEPLPTHCPAVSSASHPPGKDISNQLKSPRPALHPFPSPSHPGWG